MNMLKNILFLFCTFFLFIGCTIDDDFEASQEEDLAMLEELFAEITLIANEPCTDETEWEFVAYGSKACGGPQGYIAYPTTGIDVEAFLVLVENYTTEEAIYNSNYGIVSTCDVPAEPIDIICENEAPVLIYE